MAPVASCSSRASLHLELNSSTAWLGRLQSTQAGSTPSGQLPYCRGLKRSGPQRTENFKQNLKAPFLAAPTKGLQCSRKPASFRHQLFRLQNTPYSSRSPSGSVTVSRFEQHNADASKETRGQPQESASTSLLEPCSEASNDSKQSHLLSRRQLLLISCTTPLVSTVFVSADAATASSDTLLENASPTDSLLDTTIPIVALPELGTQQVQLVIGDGCVLGVSVYPDFEYNAGGRGGAGSARKEPDGRIFVAFDPSTLQIPPVDLSSTKFLELPLPPPLKIKIVSKKLEGYIEPNTGKVGVELYLSGARLTPAMR
jgi:hypothetical protein